MYEKCYLISRMAMWILATVLQNALIVNKIVTIIVGYKI